MSVRNLLYLAAVFGGLTVATTLWAWGQPPICTCGYIKLWVGLIWSSGNSQHIADWYSLSHVVHGLMIVPLGSLIAPRLSFNWLLLIAIVTGTAWEIIEHTEWVLGQFRESTLNQGYVGDSVLNATADYVFMMSGFFLGKLLPSLWSLALIIFLELTAALVARDSLILEAIMLVHEIEAIEEWQQELNPKSDTTVQPIGD